jgi:predicted RNase H-like HicB family nuclease
VIILKGAMIMGNITMKRVAEILRVYVIIEPDEDVYHAYCPILRGCHSSGDTEAEAFNNIQEAVRLHLEVMIEDGKAIPGIMVD